MAESSRKHLRALWRRVEEVRGLSAGVRTPSVGTLDDPHALVELVGQLVDDLERSHRRLIETQVQLLSLREVAGSLAGSRDADEAARLVARYLRGVLELDQVGLLLLDRERGELTGTWVSAEGPEALRLPLASARGAVIETLWSSRVLEHHDPRRHPALQLPETHALAPMFDAHAWFVAVPLDPAGATGATGTRALRRACDDCRLDAPLAPPPDGDAATWRSDREAARGRCLRCPNLPLLGVLVAARGADTAPPPPGERERLESVAYALSPMVENAQLMHEVTRQQRFLGDVLQSMPGALVAFAPDGRALRSNRVALESLGVEASTLVGRPARELLGEEGEALVLATLESGLPVVRREVRLAPPGRAPFPARLTTSQLQDDLGHAYGAIATFLDLTPLKAAEERARQMDQLAALGRFTSSIAHEIRNPLTGIGMGVRRLARALREQPAEAEHVEFVLSEIRRLDRIVQELFDITHPRRLDLAARPLEDTVRRAAQSLAAVFEERHVRFVLEAAPSLPPVPHDADQLQQVLINLIKNAAEASPPDGEVRVSVGRGQGAVPGVVVTVHDQGCGMDADTQRALFEPFFTTKPKGTGLGLYVTHEIVKRHGGTLCVTSEPGAGALFMLELPLEPHGGPR
jgi:PAS domain S-box-containing protein